MNKKFGVLNIALNVFNDLTYIIYFKSYNFMNTYHKYN